MGKPIIMGRRTWESLPGLLPGRTHIVVTRNPAYRADGCILARSLEQALSAAGEVPEVMVVGGAQLYAQALALADRIHLTLVHAQVEGDAFFPELNASEWRELEREFHPPDEKNAYGCSFITLERAEEKSAPTL